MSSSLILQHHNVKYLMAEILPEEYHSLKEAYKLLCDLIILKNIRIPKQIRDNLKKCTKRTTSRDWDKIRDTVKFFNPR